MDETKPTLVLEHVTKRFGGFTAVSDLSLQVRPGRVFGLIGPNGAGKTTTIRMIVNITAPDSGRIEEWLKKLERSAWKDKLAKELSKGMQQKVQFITAVIHDPDLVILDEPFSGLDPVNVDLMKQTILDQKAAGKTIILSTHQMEIAEKLCEDVCMINRARKVLDGRLREIRRSFSRNAVALQFEGGDGLL